MGIETALLASAGAGLAGNLFGAHEQSVANNRNLRAQQQQQQMMQGLIVPQLQSGQNPIAAQLLGLFGQNPQLQQPGDAQAFTYDPTLAQAPSNVVAPTLGAAPQASFNAITGLQPLQAPGATQLQSISGVDVAGPSIGESFNTGQDSLMQLLNRTIGGGDQTFGAQQTIDALQPLDQRLINQQVSGLRGSAGSLGQRFGSSLRQDEGRLREQFAQDIAARNAQLMQSAYESGQNRQLQSLGIGGQLAGQLQQSELQRAGLGQQAQLATAQNQQQANLANVSNALQARGIDVNALLQTGLANQQTGLQTALANQQTGAQTSQFNTGLQQQRGLADVQNALQALLANQQVGAQFGLQNANFQNTAGQFNAGQQANAQALNFNQANLFNQLLMGGLGQAAGIQNQQQGLNAQLLGILNGVGVPAQQPGQWGQALQGASDAFALPALFSLLRPQTNTRFSQFAGYSPSAPAWF